MTTFLKVARLIAALLIFSCILCRMIDQVVSLTRSDLISSVPISSSYYLLATNYGNVVDGLTRTNQANFAMSTPPSNVDGATVIRVDSSVTKVSTVAIQLMACIAVVAVSIWAIVSLLREE